MCAALLALDKDYFERNFHGLFAEAVIASRPGHQDTAVALTGISLFTHNATRLLLDNPCFCHIPMHDAVCSRWQR